MMDKRIILIFTLFVNFCINASSVRISGSDRAYANTELSFYRMSDHIVKSDILLGKSLTDSAGNFSIAFNVAQTTYIYCYLGTYKCFLYVEPDRQYEIQLPPKSEMTEADKLNPYFEYGPVHLVFKNMNDSDLNFYIRSFDDAWVPYFNRFAQHIYSRDSKRMIDTAVASLNQPYSDVRDTFFSIYKDYKTGLLRHLAYQQKSRAVWKQYFYNRKVEYSNPAFGELFNYVFNRYFYFFSLTKYGKELPEVINNKKSLTMLCQLLDSDSILKNKQLKELVILRNLHDEFYKANYSRSAMLLVLDSLINSTQYIEHKNIGLGIRAKVTKLMSGYEPPLFNLTDINGKAYKLEDFRGKYLYMCFCSCNSYTCMKEFDVLQTIQTVHQNRLNVVTVLTDSDTSEIRNFIAKSGYKWLFLTSRAQPDIVKQYDIRAYPTYYFIDRNGKLIWSPAPAPSEGFEKRWFEYLRDKKDL